MDYEPSQKVIEYGNATVFHKSLVKKYDEAAEKFYKGHSGIDLKTCFIIGDVLMESQANIDRLKADIANEQARTEAEESSDEDDEANLVIFNPYSYLQFNRYTLRALLVILGIVLGIVGFMLLCAWIGW